MNYEDLTDELKDKVKECKNADELLALAAREGVELTDEEIDAISGGRSDWIPDAFYY